jgi:ATP synthase protein I
MKNKIRRGLTRLLAIALVMTSLMCMFFAFFQGLVGAYSAALGGGVCILPNAYFAWLLFKYQGAHSAKKIVNSLYKGEAMKIAISIVLFAIIFAFIKIAPIAFFVTFIVVQSVFWVAPWVLITKD